MKSALYLLLPFFLVQSACAFALPYSTDGRPASWRRLSNYIVTLLWGEQETSGTLVHTAGDKGIGQRLSGKTAARDGRDIVVRFNVSTAEQASVLAEAADNLFLDVWDFTNDWVDLRVGVDVMPSLLGLLPDSLHQSYVSLMTEKALSQAITDTFPSTPKGPLNLPGPRQYVVPPSMRGSPRTSSSETNIFFQDYQPFSVIVPWLRLLASMFPTHVRMINIGYTFEGRDIPAIRVGVHPTNRDEPSSPRKTIVVVGGSHAREWISTSSVNFLAYNFVTAYGKSMTATSLLQAFDWVFIPTINPDGYVYSWTTDRLWRKNRQTTPLRFCRGLDLDRSWGFEWDGNTTKENPCSESYAGGAAFQGVEAQQLAAWAKNETENNGVEIVSFIDLHAYSQQVLYPYSFSCREAPPTLENLEELALGLAKAMRLAQGGRFYKATSACEGNVVANKAVLPRMETGGGSAIDWFYHELRVKYAYQIKLRDTGSYGFLLPKENIVPTGKEVVNALLYLGKYMMGEVGFKADRVKLTKSNEPLPARPAQQPHAYEPGDVGSPSAEPTVAESAARAEKDTVGSSWELRRR